MNKQSFKFCFCCRRVFKLKIAEPPDYIKRLFEKYSENGTMTIDQLLKFLKEFQGEENATKDEAQAIFDSIKHLNIFQRRGLHQHAFFRYLLGDLNPPINNQVHHDMNAPLAHYFLYTGHNSYLKGNQLSSDSSSIPIIKALCHGVRVIELDLWPDSTKSKVEVCHGGTLTKPVGLAECLNAIKDYAFVASEYPVVITFEDHLPSNLQKEVAKMVIKIFGNMLYRPESEYLMEFPSPESLKKRVMISTKPPVFRGSQISMEKKYSKQISKDSVGDESWGRKPTYVEADEETGATNEYEQEEQEDEGEAEQDEVPEYRQLIAIHATKLKGGLLKITSDPIKVGRLSLSEQQLETTSKTQGTNLVRFTQKNLMRVYPKGSRVDSSNFNPMLGWMHGAQMVAFNMQGFGRNLWTMQGMFRANGGCGYVKKPGFLLEVGPNDEVFDPKQDLPVKTTLKVKIYMGEGWHLDFRLTHFDLYSPPDFYVKIGIAGVPADKARKKTKAIEDQWIPIWNEEFDFPLRAPELALLRIEVLEYDTSGRPDFGGQTCLPIPELKRGIRAVPLHDGKGEKYKSVKLLMEFQFV